VNCGLRLTLLATATSSLLLSSAKNSLESLRFSELLLDFLNASYSLTYYFSNGTKDRSSD